MSQLQVSENSSAVPLSAELQEKVLLGGDLSKLTPNERLSYLKNLCQSLGLNPLSRPFEYITLNGKLTLYARKDCTEQLRKANLITIDKIEDSILHDCIYVVKAHATDKSGRHDISSGAVSIAGLKGDSLANAIMKAETKAKRRVTLSLAGLGMLDETELETIPSVQNLPIQDEKEGKELIKEMSEAILKAPTLGGLKNAFKAAYKYAENNKNDQLLEVFTKYKDARKEELEEELYDDPIRD